MIYNILDYLERAERKHPDKIVFADPDREVSYRECVKNGKAIGTAIAQKGAPRQPVAVLIDRDVESVEIFMGSVYAGIHCTYPQCFEKGAGKTAKRV